MTFKNEVSAADLAENDVARQDKFIKYVLFRKHGIQEVSSLAVHLVDHLLGLKNVQKRRMIS